MAGLNLIFAGSGAFGAPTLRALLGSEHRLVQVVSQPDRPAGRGRALLPTPISQLAMEHGLNLLRTPDINQATLAPADLMLVIAFGQKIAPHIVHHPRLGSINLHGSVLPRHRGAAPINWAIIRGDAQTGNSIIRVAPRMDAGEVLGASHLTIGELETAGELHDRLSADGPALVRQVLAELAQGRAVEQPQDESLATAAPKLRRELTRLDWTRPAVELARLIRGLYPWPGCHAALCDAEGKILGRLRLVRAQPAEDEGPRWQPGEIQTDGTIHTGQGALEIVEVQPEGGVPMPLADYRRGHAWMAGMQLRSIVS